MAKVSKTDLVGVLATKLELTKKVAGNVLDTLIETIQSELKNGNEVYVSGLGTFRPVNRPAVERRNPQTGKPVKVPPKVVLRFKPSKAVKVLS